MAGLITIFLISIFIQGENNTYLRDPNESLTDSIHQICLKG